MFRPISVPDRSGLVTIDVDGRSLQVRPGVSVALAIMEADIVPLRHTAVSVSPRSPLCLMGTCFECLCEIDGQHSVQSCMIEVADGMRVRLARGARPLGPSS